MNTLTGGTGNDRMESGDSADTYLFNRGDGQDTINDYDRNNYGKLDRAVFGAGIAVSDVAVRRSGNHLVLKVNDPTNPAATDQITIENWNTSGGLYRLEQVMFAEGMTWTTAQIDEVAFPVSHIHQAGGRHLRRLFRHAQIAFHPTATLFGAGRQTPPGSRLPITYPHPGVEHPQRFALGTDRIRRMNVHPALRRIVKRAQSIDLLTVKIQFGRVLNA
ncbi:MAG: Hemolysin-type calcium-binding region [Burkholderia sp.]|nr:Hemolysin-type calcium-binding region [Burkholderia sp.]